MPTIAETCWDCETEKAGFTMLGEVGLGQRLPQWLCTFRCSMCGAGLLVEYAALNNSRTSPAKCETDPVRHGFEVIRKYPESAPPRTLPHLPEAIASFFAQAVGALKQKNADASGAMSRKVVDVSTQQLLLAAAGEEAKKFTTIQKRIDELARLGRITDELRHWAHAVRLGGNEAAHDEAPYSQAQASELVDFVELYLTYVYTLPGRLKDHRKRAGRS